MVDGYRHKNHAWSRLNIYLINFEMGMRVERALVKRAGLPGMATVEREENVKAVWKGSE